LKKLTGCAGRYSAGFPRIVRLGPTFEIMNLTRNGKVSRPIVRNPAYRPAFARVDAALAKNSLSEPEKTRLWLTKAFGKPPGTVVNPKCGQGTYPGKSG
jgi:hypothetical protein